MRDADREYLRWCADSSTRSYLATDRHRDNIAIVTGRLGTSLDPRSRLRVRVARFEDVADMLRLIARAVDHGCRNHYSPVQRRMVTETYAASAFVDVIDAFETMVAEIDGRMAAVAQLDHATERLRALFVDADAQGHGVGRELLAHVVERAEARGDARLHGAMSLNAVPFYARAGFHPCRGRDLLSVRGISIPVVPMELRLAPAGASPRQTLTRGS